MCATLKPARKAWENLSKAYENNGLTRRLSLYRALFGTKLTDHRSMDSYLGKMSELSQQLQDIGSPVNDEFLAVIMLSGLPAHFDPLIMALENSNITLASDTVIGKLIQEYARKEHHETTALATRKIQKCFRCKKAGHFIKDCSIKKKESSKAATTTADKGNGTSGLLSALSVSICGSEWYVDSGASHHMCSCESAMFNFHNTERSEVSVANGDKLFTAGSGCVRVQLKDNCVQTINNVYYVPNLSGNLLSVSVLVKKGYKVV